MLKNKLDYKLLNFALITIIVYFMYQTGNLWTGLFNKLVNVFTPFFIAFVIAYALNPLVKYLQSKGIKKGIAVFIVIAFLLAILSIIIGLIVPLLFSQITSLFNSIMVFIKEISLDYDLNLGPLQDSLATTFNDIIKNMGKYVSDGAINLIGVSMNVLTNAAISLSVAIYLLLDMDSIRKFIRKQLLNQSKKSYYYVKELDKEMHNYLQGFIKVVGITFVEYTVVYYVIGHPNALLLGMLAACANVIPYFGGIISNCVAAITSFVISPALFFRNLITIFVLSSVDSYVINPYVYGKTNKVHPVIAILSVFAGGILLGIFGIVASLPLAIIFITTYKFFKDDISDKIEDIKMKK